MTQTFATVLKGIMEHRKNLFLVMLPWIVFALIGLILVTVPGDADSKISGMNILGVFVLVIASMVGWYSAQSYMAYPTEGPRFYLNRNLISFAFWESVIGAMLYIPHFVLSMVFVVVIIIANPEIASTNPDLLQERIGFAPVIIPTILLILAYSRLMLAAPLLVRGERQVIRRAWKASKGHAWRLFFFQVVFQIPAVIGSVLGALVNSGFSGELLILFGHVFSFILYVRLAEDEHQRLIGTTGAGSQEQN